MAILAAKTIITGDGTTALHDAAIRINERKIQDIADRNALVSQYPDEEIKDYGNATILPGLIDMHVHLGYTYSQPDQQNYDAYLVAYYALQQVQAAFSVGVTTVRDVSSPKGLCKQLRLAREKGYAVVPRIIHSDTGICMSGGHGYTDGIEEVDGPWNIRAAIRRQIRDGADWIKILTSNRSHTPEFTQEELDAAVEECHRVGVKTAVHAGMHPSIDMCIQAGFDTIEHGTFMTVEQAERMAQKGIAWTPTITAYTYLYEQGVLSKDEVTAGNPVAIRAARDQQFFEMAAHAYRDHFKMLYDTGVTVLAGSDMVLYGALAFPINQELAYMVEYGISPLEAIRTATANSASVLGLADVTGQIKLGLQADLLVVEGDASKDIQALFRVNEVYLGGNSVYKQGDQ